MWSLCQALLHCVFAVGVGATCPATCYSATCDYWDGGYWGTCSSLQSGYGCDCRACECDGCPQGNCGDTPFDPRTCTVSGNGMCDDSNNNAECAWDGGDCCAESCIGTLCGSRGYKCANPAVTGNTPMIAPTAAPSASTMSPLRTTVQVLYGVLGLRVDVEVPNADPLFLLNWQKKEIEGAIAGYFQCDRAVIVSIEAGRRLSNAIGHDVTVRFEAHDLSKPSDGIDISGLQQALGQALSKQSAGFSVSVTSVSFSDDGTPQSPEDGTPDARAKAPDPAVDERADGDAPSAMAIAAFVAGLGLAMLFTSLLCIFWRWGGRSRNLQKQAEVGSPVKNEKPPVALDDVQKLGAALDDVENSVGCNPVSDDIEKQAGKECDDDEVVSCASTATPPVSEQASVRSSVSSSI